MSNEYSIQKRRAQALLGAKSSTMSDGVRSRYRRCGKMRYGTRNMVDHLPKELFDFNLFFKPFHYYLL